MGKNHPNKSLPHKSVFRVSKNKVQKLKSKKAKPVTSNLKQLVVKNKNSIAQLDETLEALQRQSKQPKHSEKASTARIELKLTEDKPIDVDLATEQLSNL